MIDIKELIQVSLNPRSKHDYDLRRLSKDNFKIHDAPWETMDFETNGLTLYVAKTGEPVLSVQADASSSFLKRRVSKAGIVIQKGHSFKSARLSTILDTLYPNVDKFAFVAAGTQHDIDFYTMTPFVESSEEETEGDEEESMSIANDDAQDNDISETVSAGSFGYNSPAPFEQPD